MYPPSTTTARFVLSNGWNPEDVCSPVESLEPRSIHSRISLASGTVLTEKIPGRSIPGKGGRIGAAPRLLIYLDKSGDLAEFDDLLSRGGRKQVHHTSDDPGPSRLVARP